MNAFTDCARVVKLLALCGQSGISIATDYSASPAHKHEAVLYSPRPDRFGFSETMFPSDLNRR